MHFRCWFWVVKRYNIVIFPDDIDFDLFVEDTLDPGRLRHRLWSLRKLAGNDIVHSGIWALRSVVHSLLPLFDCKSCRSFLVFCVYQILIFVHLVELPRQLLLEGVRLNFEFQFVLVLGIGLVRLDKVVNFIDVGV